MSERSPQPPSLYRKTFTSLLLVVAVVVLAGGVFGTRALERRAVGQLAQSLTTSARLMAPDVLSSLRADAAIETVQPVVQSLGERGRCRVTVIDPSGVVLGDSEQTPEGVQRMENHRSRPEVHAAFGGRIGVSLRYSETIRQPMLYVASPLKDGEIIRGVLRVAVPLTVVTELRREIRRTLIVSLLIGVVL